MDSKGRGRNHDYARLWWIYCLVLSSLHRLESHAFSTESCHQNKRIAVTTKSLFSFARYFSKDDNGEGKLLLSWLRDETMNCDEDEYDLDDVEDHGFLGPVRIAESKMGYGRGLFVTEPVDEGDVLFIIPNEKCISMEQAWEDEDLYSQLENTMMILEEGNTGIDLNDDSFALMTLATKVSKEYIFSSKVGEENSYWFPYLTELNWNVDPSQHVLWWTDHEMIQIQRDYSTAIYDMAMDWRKQVNDICVLARDMLISLEDNKNEIRTHDYYEQLVRASLVHIYSRAFQDNDSGKENHQKLIPLLDMMQHTSDAKMVNIDHKTDYDTGNVIVTAFKDLEVGEELCFEYASSTKTVFNNDEGEKNDIEEEKKGNEVLKDHLFYLIYGFLP